MKVLLVLLACFFIAFPVYGFKLDPLSKRQACKPKNAENPVVADTNDVCQFRGVVSQPIHENMTLTSYLMGKQKEPDLSINFEQLIIGVRWNDDPLRFFKNHKTDFLVYYKDACGRPHEIDASWDLLYRTHCGDMQFLHAMASRKDETAADTKARIMMWAEFSYKVAIGLIPENRYFRRLDELLESPSGELFKKLMTNNSETRMLWQPEDLFSLECDRDYSIIRNLKGIFNGTRPSSLKCEAFTNDHLAKDIQDRALGSLIHLIQDSFSDSHVTRLPLLQQLRRDKKQYVSDITGRGLIDKFLIYTEQLEGAHSQADKNIVDLECSHGKGLLDLHETVSKIMILAHRGRSEKGGNWQKAKALLNQIFAIIDDNALPSGGGY